MFKQEQLLYFKKFALLQILDIIAAWLFLLSACSWLPYKYHLEATDKKLRWYIYIFTLTTISSWYLLKNANKVKKLQCLGGWKIFTFLESSGGVQPSCHNSLALWRRQSSCTTVIKYLSCFSSGHPWFTSESSALTIYYKEVVYLNLLCLVLNYSSPILANGESTDWSKEDGN